MHTNDEANTWRVGITRWVRSTGRLGFVFIRTTISQNLRTPGKFFLVLLVLVLVLDRVSGLDYEDEDDDEDDSVAAAPLRGYSWFTHGVGQLNCRIQFHHCSLPGRPCCGRACTR